jgi:thiol-disulfide isomerase/thioredoxin
MTVAGLIYADWCGHCNALKPAWNQLKAHIKNTHEIIEIESSDPTLDEHVSMINQRLKRDSDALVVRGFPTIFKIDENNLSYYNGDRSIDDMLQFFAPNKKGGAKKLKLKKHKRTKKSRTVKKKGSRKPTRRNKARTSKKRI